MNSFKKTIAFFAVICLFISCKKKETTIEIISSTPAITPPIPLADIKYNEYKIDPNKDTIIHHKSGAIIEIPKNAFLNSKGDVVTDSVDLQFRTFSNPLEIYLAGIPMNFTNNKQEELVFESAGMFEINANLPEETVKTNPNSKIKVSLNSFTNDSNFNTYDLENETQVWMETGKDKISESTREESLAKLPKLPIAPKLKTKAAFKIVDERDNSNTLAEYENVWFEPVNGKQVGYSTKDITVKNLKNGTYEVTFHSWLNLKENSNTKVICNLAFENDANYSKALTKYQNKYANKIKEDKIKREKIERDWDIYNRQLKEYNLFFAKNEIEKIKGTQKIIRSLEVNNFGFVNVDRPIDFPQGAIINPNYVDENNNQIPLKEVVLIETGKNALYKYKNEIKFNPKNDNLLWGLTKEGKLAYFSKEDFKQINQNKGKVTLKMRIHPIKLTSYDEIIAVLFPNK